MSHPHNHSVKIPAYRINFDEDFRRQFQDLCSQILSEQYFTDHTLVEQFERDFAAFSDSPFATGVSSGTMALQIALQSIDVRGKEVVLPTNTFIATADAIVCAGGIPIPVDIEEDYFGLDPRALEKVLKKNTAAVVVVHIGGLISPRVIEISQLCEARGVPLIEDCAHAHGCTLDGRSAGSFGLAGCFSFFPTKVITAGEGGMILTKSEQAFQSFRSLRRFGHTKESQIIFDRLGSNGKMTEFQAAMGILDLRRSKPRIARRVAVAQKYQKDLAGSSYRPIAAYKSAFSSHYKQIVVTQKPYQEIDRFMKSHGVNLGGGVYFHPLHRQPVFLSHFQSYFNDQRFPVADWFSNHHICLPCFPEILDSEVEKITGLLMEYERNG